MYIRVRDKDTGHEFDLPEGHAWLERGVVEHVKPKQYPPAHVARRPKYRRRLEDLTASSAVSLAEPSGEAATQEKE